MVGIGDSLIETKIKTFIAKNGEQFITACAAVFVWGLIAHAYGILNLTISHDSLSEIFASNGVIAHKITLGRFMEPVYQMIFHGRVALPWLNGLLALLWLSVSVWLTTRIFSILDKFTTILIAGIYTVNITVTALTATYITDLDADLFAAMLAVCMVFLWQRGQKSAWLGIFFLVGTLGLYQSMLSVAITLIMFVSILDLLHGHNAGKVILKGLQSIVIIIIAGALYFFLVKLSCLITGLELSSAYNGLTNLFTSTGSVQQLVKLAFYTYGKFALVFLRSSRTIYEMLFLHIIIMIPIIIVAFQAVRSRELPSSNKILCVILGILLPVGMNTACALDGGMVHDLMLYAAWLMYLFAILIANWYAASYSRTSRLPKLCRIITFFVLAVIFITDVQTANSAYVKKDLERTATLSVMTAINLQMNNTQGYIPGVTEVSFVGTPKTVTDEVFPHVRNITGLECSSPISGERRYSVYYRYVLRTPLLQRETEEIPTEIIESMPSFPQNGYIRWYDDTLVVKLSEINTVPTTNTLNSLIKRYFGH